jgi:hypothetical protein
MFNDDKEIREMQMGEWAIAKELSCDKVNVLTVLTLKTEI